MASATISSRISGAQRARRGEVDARVHDVGEEVEEAHVGEEADGRPGLELDEEVDVAVDGGLVARRGAEHGDVAHVVRAQLLAAAVQAAERLSGGHGRIVPDAGARVRAATGGSG